jgi:foldase protein PrsA
VLALSKTLRCIPALGAVFFAIVAISGCGGGVPSNSVAKVQDTGISNDAFKHWLGIAVYSTAGKTNAGVNAASVVVPDPPLYKNCIARQKVIAEREEKAEHKKTTEAELKKRCEAAYNNFKTEVMSFLLSSQWVLGEGKAMNVKLTDDEVKKQFLKIKAQQFPKQSEFNEFLKISHQTISDLLLRVKLNLLSSKIQQKIAKQKHTVTEADVQKYYNTHKSSYGQPEKRNVRVVLTNNEGQAKAALAEIKGGKSFAAVAKAKSTDPTSKNSGGELKEVAKGQEAAALDAAIFSASPHVLSGPVKTPFGYYVYEVTGTKPGVSVPLSQVKPTIKQQLTVTQNQEALSKFVKEFKKRWQDRTECLKEYTVPDCKGYKAPKTGTTGTTGP